MSLVSNIVTLAEHIGDDVRALTEAVQQLEDDGIELSGDTPAALSDTPVAGTSLLASKADHVHPFPPLANNTTKGLMSGADKAKLDAVANGATANASDSHLLDRTNHTGTQAIGTIEGLSTALAAQTSAIGELQTGKLSSIPLATTTVVGGVKVGAGLAVDSTGLLTASGGREVLTSNRAYYVRVDGADYNTGLVNNAGGAFQTIQKAVDVASSLDLSIYSALIYVQAGTYNTPVVLKSYVGSGIIEIIGPFNMTSVIVQTTADSCFRGVIGSKYRLSFMRLLAGGTGSTAINCIAGGIVEFEQIDFGASAWAHISAGPMAFVQAVGNYKISGASPVHWYACDGGSIRVQAKTVTITGTPAFSGSFSESTRAASVLANANTFSGAATGKRYVGTLCGVTFTNGGGASAFPGSVAGTVATGAQYA